MDGPVAISDCREGVCCLHTSEPMLMTKYVTVRRRDGSDYNGFKCSDLTATSIFRWSAASRRLTARPEARGRVCPSVARYQGIATMSRPVLRLTNFPIASLVS